VRCVQTAEILAKAAGGRAEVVLRDELRPLADPSGLLSWTEQQQERYEQIAWVGHAPDVDRLTAMVIGHSGGRIHFRKGAVAAVRLDGSIRSGPGELRWLVTAKLLDC
jgi:phosphohistidine phosphatase SixA